jgi:glycosyltransferase involved in cell wall biosynthesis
VANSGEFARALKYLEDDNAIRSRLAANGQQYVLQTFSYDRVLEKYLRVFDEIVFRVRRDFPHTLGAPTEERYNYK